METPRVLEEGHTFDIGEDDAALIMRPNNEFQLISHPYPPGIPVPPHVVLIHAVALRLSEDLSFRRELFQWIAKKNEQAKRRELQKVLPC
jgi:hypothetical protein